MPKATYPGGNPAPVYHNGAFYLTNQKTTEIYTTTTLGTLFLRCTQRLQAVCWLLWFIARHIGRGAHFGGHTKRVYSLLFHLPADDPEGWTVYSQISHETVPVNWMIEDPCVMVILLYLVHCSRTRFNPLRMYGMGRFLWIDTRGSWHIINHAYNNHEFEQCGNSTLSAHFFSTDGKTWHNLGTRPCAKPPSTIAH